MPLREARPDDTRAIARVHVQSWRQTYDGILPKEKLEGLEVDEEEAFWERMLERQGEASATLVAEPDDGVVGFAAGGPARDEALADEGEVYALYVLERHQGEGLGRRLFEAVLAHLRGRELAPVGLWVLEANPTVGFYEHLGGKRVDRRGTEHGLEEVRYRWQA